MPLGDSDVPSSVLDIPTIHDFYLGFLQAGAVGMGCEAVFNGPAEVDEKEGGSGGLIHPESYDGPEEYQDLVQVVVGHMNTRSFLA